MGRNVVGQEAQAEYGRLWAPTGEKYEAKIKVLEIGALMEASRHSVYWCLSSRALQSQNRTVLQLTSYRLR